MDNTISLSASMRTILLNLQNTQRLFDTTQNRLATNKKVNSALDSPAAYFTAQSLNSRATALDGLLDSMGQAVQTLKAADAGITSLTGFVEQAKALVNQSLDNNNIASYFTSGQTLTVNQPLSGIGGVVPTDSFTVRTGNAHELHGTSSISLSQTLQSLGFPNNADDNNFILRLAGEGGFQDVKISVSTSGAPGTLRPTDTVQSLVDAINLGFGVNERGEYRVDARVEDGNLVITSRDVEKTLTAIEGTLPNGAPPPATLPTTYAKDTLGLDTGYVIDMASNTPIKQYHQISTLGGIFAQNTLVGDLGMTAGSFDMSIGSTTRTFTIDATTTAQGLLDSINQAFTGMVKAKLTAGSFDILSIDPTQTVSFSNNSGNFVASANFQPVNDPTVDVYELMDRIKSVPGVDCYVTSEGKLRVETSDGQDLIITDMFNVDENREGYVASALGISGAATNGSSLRRSYAGTYNGILVQINRFVTNNDAGYRGVNLLNGQDLTVNFNDDRTSNLVIQSVVFNTDGLGLKQAANDWVSREDVEKSLAQIDAAMIRIKAQSSEFGQNLSSIQNREDFARSMVDVLSTGSDALVLADTNEEGANLLALQLRQQLAMNALSMASTSAQSVLRLFS